MSHVLVIESDPDRARAAARALEGAGFRVLTAADAEHAQQLLGRGGSPAGLAAAGEVARLRGQLEEEAGRRRALEALLAAERGRLRALIDNLPDHIFIKDAAGHYVVD